MQLRCLAGALICAAAAAGAQDRFVSEDGAHLEPFTNWAMASTNLLEAVNLANAAPGYTVWISNGTYVLTNRINVGDTVVRGAGGSREDVVVSGGGATNCFYLNHAGAVVEDLTVSNGYSTIGSTGPGAHITTGGGTLRNCIVGWCQGYYPGGVEVFGRGIVTNCLIVSNTASMNSGGLRIESQFGGTMATVVCCRIEGNVSGSGAGVNMSGGTLQDCRIAGNNQTFSSSGQGGGGVMINNSVPSNYFSIRNCVIEGNTSASYGGGVWNKPLSTMRYIENTVIRSNTSQAYGGGGLCLQSNLAARSCLIANNSFNGTTPSAGGAHLLDNASLENCTMADNLSATAGAGGLYVAGAAAEICNTIMSSNRLGAAGSDLALAQAGWTNNFRHCCAGAGPELPAAQGNLAEAPGWLDPEAGDYRLRADSPCVNHGTNAPWMATAADLAGGRRIDRVVRAVDIGAYELVPGVTMFIIQ